MLETTAINPSMDQSEASSEVIGLLTAISIVSKRMAKNLALLERQASPGRSDAAYAPGEAAGAADQSRAV